MKLYVARHGETTWNKEHKICGRTEVPLTEKGWEQAAALAERVSGLGISAIVASPMRRAQDTAACVGKRLGLPVQTDDRLIEQCYGEFEGEDYRSKPLSAHGWQFACAYPGGGESMMQVAARTYPLIDELRRRYRGKSVLLVCHGSIARVIHTYFHNVTNEEFAAFRMDNGEVFAYEADDLPEDNRSVTVRALQEDVSSFNRARDWTGLSALNFAASISIEAAELLEIFQWCDQKQADQKALVTEREHFLEELADVLIYSIGLADQYGVDLTDCVREKLKKNAVKYPIKASGPKDEA